MKHVFFSSCIGYVNYPVKKVKYEKGFLGTVGIIKCRLHLLEKESISGKPI